jgi:hypothetical protein
MLETNHKPLLIVFLQRILNTDLTIDHDIQEQVGLGNKETIGSIWQTL